MKYSILLSLVTVVPITLIGAAPIEATGVPAGYPGYRAPDSHRAPKEKQTVEQCKTLVGAVSQWPSSPQHRDAFVRLACATCDMPELDDECGRQTNTKTEEVTKQDIALPEDASEDSEQTSSDITNLIRLPNTWGPFNSPCGAWNEQHCPGYTMPGGKLPGKALFSAPDIDERALVTPDTTDVEPNAPADITPCGPNNERGCHSSSSSKEDDEGVTHGKAFARAAQLGSGMPPDWMDPKGHAGQISGTGGARVWPPQ